MNFDNFDIEQSSAKLQEFFKIEFSLATPFTIFQSEVKRWLKHCEYGIKPVDEQKQTLRVDGKPAHPLSEPSDSFINALKTPYPSAHSDIFRFWSDITLNIVMTLLIYCK